MKKEEKKKGEEEEEEEEEGRKKSRKKRKKIVRFVVNEAVEKSISAAKKPPRPRFGECACGGDVSRTSFVPWKHWFV